MPNNIRGVYLLTYLLTYFTYLLIYPHWVHEDSRPARRLCHPSWSAANATSGPHKCYPSWFLSFSLLLLHISMGMIPEFQLRKLSLGSPHVAQQHPPDEFVNLLFSFHDQIILQSAGINNTPNPQPGGPVTTIWSGLYPLTCPPRLDLLGGMPLMVKPSRSLRHTSSPITTRR